MRRWTFILMGGLGAGLVALAAFMLWMTGTIEPRLTTLITVCCCIIIPIGLALCILGLVQGRRAGELDITAYTRTPRRDHGVAGSEIDFECPICHKGYRASPLLAGKPFICRECRERFEVPNPKPLAPPAGETMNAK